jgi:dipeptidyl aminopeptidase/acylaminoacyl peptidase
LYFANSGIAWAEVKESGSIRPRPEIVVEQSSSEPPKIIAMDPKTGEKFMLLDLNPQFAGLQLAQVEPIGWKSETGIEEKGGLYYPLDYVPGKRYPLVIQTHGFNSDRFEINGLFEGAPFAAQALAGSGIMVLQAGYNLLADRSADNTSREAAGEISSFEGAIKYLDKRGLIDLERVGIVGFSRTCFHVKYALIHSKYHFAAASVSDGVDFGYFQYLLVANSPMSVVKVAEDINGARPFGSGLNEWFARSPGFNIDKVHTPLLIMAANPTSLLAEWEWFAALVRLGKPVDMIYLRNGDHPLEKPWDRRISQQGTVDWFCFWLKGQEDPDPAKADQYARWRDLRRSDPMPN